MSVSIMLNRAKLIRTKSTALFLNIDKSMYFFFLTIEKNVTHLFHFLLPFMQIRKKYDFRKHFGIPRFSTTLSAFKMRFHYFGKDVCDKTFVVILAEELTCRILENFTFSCIMA